MQEPYPRPAKSDGMICVLCDSFIQRGQIIDIWKHRIVHFKCLEKEEEKVGGAE